MTKEKRIMRDGVNTAVLDRNIDMFCKCEQKYRDVTGCTGELPEWCKTVDKLIAKVAKEKGLSPAEFIAQCRKMGIEKEEIETDTKIRLCAIRTKAIRNCHKSEMVRHHRGGKK